MPVGNRPQSSASDGSDRRAKIIKILVVLFVVFVIGIYWNWKTFFARAGDQAPAPVAVLDVQTGTLSAGRVDVPAVPVEESRSDAAQAAVDVPQPKVNVTLYSCGACSDAEIFGGIAIKMTPEAQAASRKTAGNDPEEQMRITQTIEEGTLLAKYVKGKSGVDSLEWFSQRSPEGEAVYTWVNSQCGGKTPVTCAAPH